MDLSMDLSRVEAKKGSSGPVPPGEYEVRIAGTEYKEAKSGNGGYLRIQYKVVDGIHTGRSIFENLNLWHNSDQTRMIAQSQLKGLAQAIHHPNPNFIRSTEELIGGSLKVRVVVDGDFNNVKCYMESGLQQSAPAAPQNQYQAAPQVPQTSQNTPPPPPPSAPTAAESPW